MNNKIFFSPWHSTIFINITNIEMANVSPSPNLFKKSNTDNGQNTSIKNHHIIFPLSPGHMNITVILETSILALAKQSTPIVLSKYTIPIRKTIHIKWQLTRRHVNCTLTGALQSTVRHAYANAKITFSMNHLTA